MLIIPFIGFFLASSFQKYLLLDDRVIASMVDGKLVPGEARKHPSNPGIVTAAASASASAAASGMQVHLAFTGDLTSMGVTWRTAGPTNRTALVEWTEASSSSPPPMFSVGTTKSYTIYGRISGYYHHSEMVNLKSKTEYKYRVSSEDGGWSTFFNFTSPNTQANLQEVVRTFYAFLFFLIY